VKSMIAFCGLDCGECKALIATQDNDREMKKALAEEWSREFGHAIKPEDINCVGCVVLDGPHINYCNICEIRSCGTQKKIQNCAYCVEYKCEKLERFHENAAKARDNLEEVRKEAEKKHA
jgi:hypothetical protein